MTVAFAGMAMFAPRAVIRPLLNTIVPLGMGAEVTGAMGALRMATSGFLPGLLGMTDWANAEVVIMQARRPPASRRRSGRRAGGATLDALRALGASLIIGNLRLGLVVALAWSGRLLVLRFFVRFFLQALLLFRIHRFAHAQVAGVVEEDLAVDEGALAGQIGPKGMAGPDDEIGVLADIDRA